MLAIAAGVRLLVLREYWNENPFAHFPTLDSALYWNRGGAIAAGEWWTGEPFHIAPLYPFLLGALRRLGCGLQTISVLQMILHLFTSWLIATATRARFGSAAGCVAAALFLGLAEPALFATRILGTSLQLALVGLLWWDWTKLASNDDRGRILPVCRVGLWIGLLALAFPAAMLLVPVFALWTIARSGPASAAGWRRLAAGAATAVLVIAPATVYNAIAAHELIPITSHAGITLAAGNGPGSTGIFTPIADTSGAVANQAQESARAYESATGRAGSWREIDAYFRDRTLRWWREHPLDATRLFARKAWWFVTSRHYDNITAFSLEREHGLQDASAWIPIELPWILGLAGIGFAIAARRRQRLLPELAIITLSLFVCVVFMYSARYRILAAPVLCGLAAAGIVHTQRSGWRPLAVAGVAALPLVFLVINGRTGFGSVDFMRADFERLLADRYVMSGLAHRENGDRESAIADLRRAVETSGDRVDALRTLAGLYLESGRAEEARAAALAAVERDPGDALAHRLLHDALVRSGDFREVGVALENIAELDPENPGVQIALAWYYAACPDAGLRDPERALRHARAAERLRGANDPDAVMAMVLAAAAAGNTPEATAAARRGASIADARGDEALARSFAELSGLVQDGRPIAAPPRLLAGR